MALLPDGNAREGSQVATDGKGGRDEVPKWSLGTESAAHDLYFAALAQAVDQHDDMWSHYQVEDLLTHWQALTEASASLGQHAWPPATGQVGHVFHESALDSLRAK
jgi:hypothetical protein